jgi:hypothetical protein
MAFAEYFPVALAGLAIVLRIVMFVPREAKSDRANPAA